MRGGGTGFYKWNSLWKFSWPSIVLFDLLGCGWCEQRGVAGAEVLPLALHVTRSLGKTHLCSPLKIVPKICSLHAHAGAKNKEINRLFCAALQKRFIIRACVWCEYSPRGVAAAALACLMWSINCYKDDVTFVTLMFFTSVFIETCPSPPGGQKLIWGPVWGVPGGSAGTCPGSCWGNGTKRAVRWEAKAGTGFADTGFKIWQLLFLVWECGVSLT